MVLSACNTALGAIRAGEGIESLARAFIYSGARAVVASLWQVGDRAAAETMARFYEGYLKKGLPPAQALREAKLALRRGYVKFPGSTSPASWAPFIWIGLAR